MRPASGTSLLRALTGAVFALASFPAAASAEDRHLAVVIDTSGSMLKNDPERYTVQATKILSDLLDERDRMIAIHMPSSESCSDGPNPSLGVVFDGANRAAFKSAVDASVKFESGTYFAAPVRTAVDFLAKAPNGRRLLLVVADADGFGGCDPPLTAVLQAYRGTGGAAGVVKLGGNPPGLFTGNRDFSRHPAFEWAHAARNSRELIETIAAVYQSFIGSRKPQTGDVSGRVEVTIDELVSEAFFVVAADGPMGALSSSPQNPYAAAMDLDLHGGGLTKGNDDVERAYRVARLTAPDAGKWVFEAASLHATSGYMLIQDYAVALRMVSPGEVPRGRDTPLAFEVVDPRTRKRVPSPAFLGNVQVTAEVGGKKVPLTRGPDGTFRATVRFDEEGKKRIVAELRSDRVTKTAIAEVEVVRPAWALVAEVPARTDFETPVKLVVRVVPSDPAGPAPTTYPDRVRVQGAEGTTELADDGRNGDERAGDHLYTAVWTPRTMGAHPLVFEAVGGDRSTPAAATVDVVGKLRFGEPVPIAIGPLRSESTGTSALRFTGADVKGEFELGLTSTFSSTGAALEIDPGGGYQPLGKRPIALRLDTHGPREFAVRLRTGACPAGCDKREPAALTVKATGPDGAPVELRVPLEIEVVPDPWLVCYWPFLALGAALLIGGVVFHGFWSPARFGPRLGVKLSPEEDIEEGVFYTLRAQPGTGSGFYRDARAFISADFRLSGSSRGAIARLRAHGPGVLIEAAGGAPVFRQTADGEWEMLPAGESKVRFGTLYRDETGKIFFQLRTS